MLKLIKNECNYFKAPLAAILLLLLIFTFAAFNNIQLFNQIPFLKKYLWSMIIGLGAYGIVFFLWMQRVKENHERILFLLPTSLKVKKWSRWLYAIIPFTLVMIYIQILHFFLPEIWKVHIGRISAQIGFLSMALASIFIVRDIWFVKAGDSQLYKILIGIIIFAVTAAGALLIIVIFNYDIVVPLYIHQEELFFFLWGIIVSAISLITYEKRKAYLE